MTAPRPSHRGHMPPVMLKLRRSFLVVPPRWMVTAPAPEMEATLNEYAWGEPMCGFPSRLKRMRNIALASVAVPTVERGSEPIRSWSTRIAVVSPSSTSTSGRAIVGMKPCTKALYVSLIRRCDSAAIVPNTSELLPEPETPVNTVSRRFTISTLTSLRLFTRAPCTRIRSWLSAAWSAGVSVLVAVLILSPRPRAIAGGVRRSGRSRSSRLLDAVLHRRVALLGRGEDHRLRQLRPVAEILELQRLQVILERLHEPLRRLDLAELALDGAERRAEAVRAAGADVHLLDDRVVAPPFGDQLRIRPDGEDVRARGVEDPLDPDLELVRRGDAGGVHRSPFVRSTTCAKRSSRCSQVLMPSNA